MLERVTLPQPSWKMDFASQHGPHPFLQTLPKWIEKNVRATLLPLT